MRSPLRTRRSPATLPFRWARLAFFMLGAGLSLPVSSSAAAPLHWWRNAIPPRLQWNANSGYCGEVCFISAGLYYGQYLSQYDARAAIGPDVRQNHAEILLGVNDRSTAAHLHLAAEEWNPSGRSRTPREFLAWVKRQVLRGHPVAIGVYNNESRLYGHSDPNSGDPTYDHIVGVVGIGSPHALTGRRAYASDTILFSGNGLWGVSPGQPGPRRNFFFRAIFATFPADRVRANAPDGPIYSLPDGVPNYGAAITGIIDRKHETLPVRLATNPRHESPQIARGSNRRPPGRPLVLTITISDLQPGIAYNLYRYDSLASVPDSDFNRHAAQAAQRWTIRISSGSTCTFTQRINSNDIADYRAVRAD
ncbi:MAG: hypothetical protein PHC88_08775 [Terrimicrobiaceae bacterium]|nr:hypothetical protein [Terrimicrobiaceae bacterium]